MLEGNKKTIKNDVRTILVMQGLSLTSGIFLSACTSRWLGPEGRGIVNLFTMLPTTAMLIFSMSIYKAMPYVVHKLDKDIGKVISTYLFISLVVSLFVMILYSTFLHKLEIAMGIPAYLGLFSLSIFTIPLYLLNYVGIYCFISIGDTSTYSSFDVIRQVCYLSLLFLFVVIYGAGTGGALISIFGSLLMMSLVLWRKILSTHRVFDPPSKSITKDIFKFSLFAHPGTVLEFLHLRSNALLVSSILGAASFGLYSAASSLSELITLIPQQVGQAVLSHSSRLSGLEGARLTLSVVRISLLSGIFCAAVLGLLAKYIIILLHGPMFVSALHPLLLLLPGAALLGTNRILEGHFVGIGRTSISSFAEGAGLVVSIAANTLFLKSGGLEAAGIITSMSISVCFIILMLSFIFINKFTFVEVLVWDFSFAPTSTMKK